VHAFVQHKCRAGRKPCRGFGITPIAGPEDHPTAQTAHTRLTQKAVHQNYLTSSHADYTTTLGANCFSKDNEYDLKKQVYPTVLLLLSNLSLSWFQNVVLQVDFC
jgi:hypothetical protein